MGKRRGFTERELRILRGISEEQTEKMKGTRFWRNLDFLLYLFLVVVLAFGVRKYLVEPVRVDGVSMAPTLVDGEHMLVEKASYWFQSPARGEIIICYYPGYTESCVKRVIGLPGETVQIEGGVVYINGAPLDERDYWNDTIAGDYPAYTVPEGMVFDQWTISEESLLGNPNVAYNAESFTIPANAVEKGKTVTVEAQYREASIEDDGPGILETAAMIGVAGTGAAVLGYTGYMIGTELYLNTVLPAGAAIPNNAGELALLLWQNAGKPEPAALPAFADTADVETAKAAQWCTEQGLLTAEDSAFHPEQKVTKYRVIRVWKQAAAPQQ